MADKVNLQVAAELGAIVASRRRQLGLKQQDLASDLGMTSAQLCKIEKGRNLPDDETLLRLERCLDWTPRGLVESKRRILKASEGEGVHRLADLAAVASRKGSPRFVEFCRSRDPDTHRCLAAAAFRPVMDLLGDAIDSLANLESDAGCLVGDFLREPPSPFGLDSASAKALAQEVRSVLLQGEAPVTDWLPALELSGCRIVFTDRLPCGIVVKGYFDRTDLHPVFAVSPNATSEHQTYELAVELAFACLFARGGYATVCYTEKIGVFVRDFVSEFLMPDKTLARLADGLGLGPGDWTTSAVLSVKRLFGVSSLALVWCLWGRGLLSPERFASLREAAEDYARRHPASPERRPLPPLQKDWLRRQLTARLAH